MGMYDTVWFKKANGEDDGIQFKCGENICKNYELSDSIDLPNGIYFGWEGAFIVYGKMIVAIFDSDEPFMFDKWGGQLESPKLER